MVVLVVRPWEVITTHVSICMSMLGIDFESYGHVLGRPRVSSDSEKINIFPFFRPFFNGLIKKFQNVIQVIYGVHFWHKDTHFHTQSVHFTPGTTLHISRAAETPREALFS